MTLKNPRKVVVSLLFGSSAGLWANEVVPVSANCGFTASATYFDGIKHPPSSAALKIPSAATAINTAG